MSFLTSKRAWANISPLQRQPSHLFSAPQSVHLALFAHQALNFLPPVADLTSTAENLVLFQKLRDRDKAFTGTILQQVVTGREVDIALNNETIRF